jgi:ABC-2 type transport system permease protein
MPMPIQVITHVVPARYFVTIVRGIFLKGIGMSLLWGQVLFLVGFSILVFFAAERKMRQKLA